ncbi:MAG: hypothetical protein GTN57_09180 [Acidobacteria bacterium]|nr:hypothetical protein [Acidobacteriota bacterium]NIQ85520.1 hypothetical protein [Acidobacteriota bacterium]NIT11241.1 hypothetical protein [Acidobacteriota bacterium]
MGMFEELFKSLNEAGVRYVVVGGLAVVLHGHPRLTADIDLVVDLDPAAAGLAIETLTAMGFRPRVPVDPAAFADPVQRRAWIEERGMKVFSLYDPNDPLRSVDLFVEPPIPFAELWSRSKRIALPDGDVRVASIGDLITMKEIAGRPQDSEDIKALEVLRDEQETD